ncbi:DUF5684 domain-containing protein [Ferruginibacter sp. HRS2-29]|uniref:DUF5684 domain-containing protein n=1 Tax=Ferruginibacter sp. HRS2-29 TaxID=2487334 RepID=UPI0020CD331B|nr:DUF5684 domain-containing protein [Ferruginibacter sp. HRS2-29]MCP9753110.1 signal peptidase I [Ferruginibacter sp. HRS2-29]
MGIILVIYLALIVFIIASIWKTFEKAGEPGWAAIVPIYNFYVMCKISGTKNWWLIFIPFANIYIAIVSYIALAKSFGKDTGFGIGLFLLGFIFFPMLGFGDAKYIGPNGQNVFQAEIDAIGAK